MNRMEELLHSVETGPLAPMATVFVVVGSTGEYSDRSEWMVRAFLNRGAAEALVLRLAAWCDVRQCGENAADIVRPDEKPAEDPGFRCDYTGTRYSVAECPIDLSPCTEHDDCRAHPDLGVACVADRRRRSA